MDYFNMTSPCGLDCFNCPGFIANKDTKLRKVISKSFNIPFEDAKCGGCRNEKGRVKIMGDDKSCRVFSCTQSKNIDFCCECSDFPCKELQPYADKASERPHNTKIYNLCLIKKLGVVNWAENNALGVRESYFNEKLSVHKGD